MPARKQKKHISFLIYLLPITLLLIVLIFFFSRKKVCGYRFENGFGLSCSCLGVVKPVTDEQGLVSDQGTIDYCYGLAKTKVCFKQFDAQKPSKPYLCSEYPYEVSLLIPSSTQSRTLYPDSKYAYDAKLSDGSQVVLETQHEATCQRMKVQGFAEKISIGGTSPTYQGFHVYAVDFVCLE